MSACNISFPVAPGDDLWWASETADAGPGPSLIQARLAEDAVEAVQFNGTEINIITDGGNIEKINDQYTCIDKQSCLDWIKSKRPESILLDKRTVNAVHITPLGEKELINLECSVTALERLFSSSSLASDTPDSEGTFAIYQEGANAENSCFTTFIRDTAGNPVRALYGELLLVRHEFDPKTGMRVLTDISKNMAEAVKHDDAARPEHAYDPNFWRSSRNMTAGMLRKFLDEFPDDAIIHCCGTNQTFWHWCPATKALNIDCDDLADLPEYQGHEPMIISGPDA